MNQLVASSATLSIVSLLAAGEASSGVAERATIPSCRSLRAVPTLALTPIVLAGTIVLGGPT